jgi:hypothetical protein
MSRAFVKEAESPEPRCPERQGCGGLGVTVGPATLAAQLSAEAAATLIGETFYCPNPACGVAYFAAGGGSVLRGEQRARSWPKDAAAPVCPCFGILEHEIAAWARAREKPDMPALRALLARIEGPEAQCGTRAPDGRPCATQVRRVFMRELARRPGAP